MRAPDSRWTAWGDRLIEVGRSSLEAVERIGLPIVIGLGIASAQITLLFRGDHVADGIAASLVWMAGAVLLSDVQEQHSVGRVEPGRRWRRGLGLAALGWCLLVLTFSARFYDPLLFLIPLACFSGIALLEGTAIRSRTMRDLILIACLLPLQNVLASALPTAGIVALTAKLACAGLWAAGRECTAEGQMMLLLTKTVKIDPPCAGVDTLCLALTSSLMFLVLFPIRRHWFTILALIGGSVGIAFLLNVVRVVALSLSSRQCDKHWWSQWCGFNFWHVGTGSHLFAFLAVTAVCALWWWNIHQHEPNASADAAR